MDLIKTLKEDAHQAVKERKSRRAQVLRYLISLLEKEEIRLGEKFDQAAALAVLQKEMKQKEEALKMFRRAGREDLIREQEEEIEILAQYLPKMMTREEIKELVEKIIKEEENLNFGRIMGKVMPMVKGKADGQLVAEVVRELLS